MTSAAISRRVSSTPPQARPKTSTRCSSEGWAPMHKSAALSCSRSALTRAPNKRAILLSQSQIRKITSPARGPLVSSVIFGVGQLR